MIDFYIETYFIFLFGIFSFLLFLSLFFLCLRGFFKKRDGASHTAHKDKIHDLIATRIKTSPPIERGWFVNTKEAFSRIYNLPQTKCLPNRTERFREDRIPASGEGVALRISRPWLWEHLDRSQLMRGILHILSQTQWHSFALCDSSFFVVFWQAI